MRKLALMLAVLVVLGLAAIPTLVTIGQEGQAGDSNIVHVDLRPPYMWGTMHYNLSGCTLDFVFNGHGLEPGASCRLQFWQKVPLIRVWLGQYTMVNPGGNVHIAGSQSMTEGFTDLQLRLVCQGYGAVLRSEPEYSFTYDCPE